MRYPQLLLFLLISAAGVARADCWHDAAEAYGLDPMLLGAIACVESGMDAHAVSNAGAIGVMQVMPTNARMVGIAPRRLYEACTGIYMGAYVLASMYARYGGTWEAVGAYNAACTKLKGRACLKARSDYAWRVYRARRHLLATGACGLGKES